LYLLGRHVPNFSKEILMDEHLETCVALASADGLKSSVLSPAEKVASLLRRCPSNELAKVAIDLPAGGKSTIRVSQRFAVSMAVASPKGDLDIPMLLNLIAE
jgi:hypothetical protein